MCHSPIYLYSHDVPCRLGTPAASCSPSRTPLLCCLFWPCPTCERGSWQSWMIEWAPHGPQPDPTMLGLPGADLWWRATATGTRTVQTYQQGVEVASGCCSYSTQQCQLLHWSYLFVYFLYLHLLWDWYRYWRCLQFPLWGQCSTLLLVWWCYPLLRTILSEVEHDSHVLSMVKKTGLKKLSATSWSNSRYARRHSMSSLR